MNSHLGRNSWEELQEEFEVALSVIKPLVIQAPPDRSNKRLRARQKNKNADGNLVPVSGAVDPDELAYARSMALECVKELAPLIRARKATPRLILKWGTFQFYCALAASPIFVGNKDRGRARSVDASLKRTRKDIQRKWIARELYPLILKLGKSRRHQAEIQLEKRILVFIEQNACSKRDDCDWLKDLLGRDRTLKGTYRSTLFPFEKVKAFATDSMIGVPPPLGVSV